MVLVFDIGGTNTRTAVMRDGKLGEIVRMATDSSTAGFEAIIAALHHIVPDTSELVGVVGCLPVQLRGDSGEIVRATNLPAWQKTRVIARLKEEFGVPVHVANDVELCGLGECHARPDAATGVMVYITVSTGVNAVRIVDGVVDRTIARYELGYQIIDFDDTVPQQLEKLIGGGALEKRLGIAPPDVQDGQVWRGLERYLAAGVYNAILYWNPRKIVFGGSMMRDLKLEYIRQHLETLPRIYDDWPVLESALLADEAGVQGALAWATQLGLK
jgi:predicted NBD/HSP70 family sugar kinase